MGRLGKALAVLAGVVLVPSVAVAQATIAGAVRDASGAVLPGVTVEASSPALIEKVRTVVTDGTGQYRIIDLRPGLYSVTFTLPGFNTVRREGIELSGTAVANIEVELRVGAVEETVTVTGEAPTVDIRSTRQESVISDDVLAAIPSGRSHYHLAVLIPGMNTGVQDVGGAAGVQVTGSGSIHGATSGRLMNDGLTVGHNGESLNMWVSNIGGAQETAISTSGGLGEAETGGVVINVIPKDGSNTFSGSVFYSGANDSMASSNFTDELRRQGLRVPNSIFKVYDFNPTFGGRIVRDRLWFFATHRYVGAYNYVAGMFRNLNAGDLTKWTYAPSTEQAIDMNRYITGSIRLTAQVNMKNKVSVFWDDQWGCVNCYEYGGTATTSPEASARSDRKPTRVYQATWQSPATNRLLLEAGYGAYMQRWGNDPRNDGTYHPALIQVTEQAGAIPGLTFRAAGNFGHHWTGIQTWRGAISYVTGAHSFKVGYLGGHQAPIQNEYGMPHGISNIRMLNGAPNQLTLWVDRSYQGIVKPIGLYVQDQWTMGRLTVQGGLRYDRMQTDYAGGDQVDVPTIKAGPLIPRPIEFTGDVLEGARYQDLTPRVGAAYDLFGTGKTAFKVTLGKYMETVGAVGGGGAGAVANALNPLNRVATTTNRSWNDLDRDFVPDCDLRNPLGNGECGAMSDRRFGTSTFSSTPDYEAFRGWGKRMYNWEFGVNVQHEVMTNVAVNVGYFRRWFGNFLITDNRAVTAADYDRFSITLPTDPRLPNSGQVLSGLIDVNPAKFGQVDNYTTLAKNYGDMKRRWHGVDVTSTVRMQGITFQGGMSVGTEMRDECEIREQLPETFFGAFGAGGAQFPFCSWETPWLPQVKALGAYTIPRVDVQVSATFQSIPGILPNQQTSVVPVGLGANLVVLNAQAAATLGRPLAGNAANVVVNIMPPGGLYGDRTNQLDVRFAKIFRVGGRRIQAGLDMYNATNTNAVQNYNQTYGPAWLTPTSILTARFFKISAQLDF
jgi:hypothetical protein